MQIAPTFCSRASSASLLLIKKLAERLRIAKENVGATPGDQSKKLVEEAKNIIGAVELNPAEADKAMGQPLGARRTPMNASAYYDD